MDNFKYAPGMPGYGYPGIDGSSGLIGLAVYFTSYDGGGTDTTTIKNKIDHNLILSPLVSNIPGYPTRKYQNGDIFIDINGKAYEIDLNIPNRFASAGYDLSGNSLFVRSNIPGTSPPRYSNTYPNKLIDTVNAEVLSSTYYTDYPAVIYGIESKKFARIEYSNTNPDISIGRNPFSLFIGAGTNANADYAIALVRDIANNNFRLGNLDVSENIRNINLIFDVLSLKQNKTNNHFTRTEPDGTIITNHEVDSNNLLNPIFIYNPASFKSIPISETLDKIEWDQRHFFSTNVVPSGISANLYFSQKQSPYNNKNYGFTPIDPSICSLVFPEIDVSGTISISNLETDIAYEAYITFFDKGWMRNSEIIPIGTGVTLVITPPAAACYGTSTVDLTAPAVTAGSTVGLTYTYWTDPNATTPLVNPTTVNASGTYYIKGYKLATPDIYAISPVVVTVTVIAAPTGAASQSRCVGNTVANLTVTASGTKKYYTVPTGGSPILSSTQLVNGTTYYVSQTIGGCESATRLAIAVTVNPTPIGMTASIAPNPALLGTTITFTANANGAPTYGWYRTLSDNVNIDPGWVRGGYLSFTESAVAAHGGPYNYYWFYVQSSFGCTNSVGPIILNTTTPAQPTITPTSGVTSGDVVVYTTQGGMSGYSWTVSGGSGSSSSNTISVTWGAAGTGHIQVSYTNGIVVTSPNYAIPIAPIAAAGVAPVAAFTGTPLSGCGGQTVTFSNTTSGTAPVTYAWTFGDGGTSTDVNPTHAYAAGGPYTVALVATNGFGTNTLTRTGYISFTAIPATPTIAGSLTYCTGGSGTTLTSSSATGNVWSNGATTQSITNVTAGSYTVHVTASGCSSAESAPAVVSVVTPEAPVITRHFTAIGVPGQTGPYPGQAGVIYTCQGSKSSYVWTVSNGTIVLGSGTNTINVTLNASPENYTNTVTVYYTDGGCVSSTTIYNDSIEHYVSIDPTQPQMFSTSGALCPGAPDGNFYINGTPGAQWYVQAGQTWCHLETHSRYPSAGYYLALDPADVPVAVMVSSGRTLNEQSDVQLYIKRTSGDQSTSSRIVRITCTGGI